MDGWRKDGRRDIMVTDLDTLIPRDHLLRKIEKVMDYDWLYKRVESLLLCRQWSPRNRSGCADKNGSNPAFIRNSVFASNSP